MMRVTVVSDLREECWPSMDYTADAIAGSLCRHGAGAVAPLLHRPPMLVRFAHVGTGWGHTADRLLNRFWDYPRSLRQRRADGGIFHIADHSYAHLVHGLPADRTVVTCHDTDTFRCLIDPAAEPRSIFFRAMTRRILDGFRKAARIIADSRATRRAIVEASLVPEGRVAVVPLPVAPAFSARGDADHDAWCETQLGPAASPTLELLHVGSTIDRKRIDRLLDVVAAVRRHAPGARLLRVGGAFTPDQQAQVVRLGLADAIACLPSLTQAQLAAVYRRADLVLLTPDREGFGLPVVESLASGTPVVASDLPVLREVGGAVTTYCAPDTVDAWVTAIVTLHEERVTRPDDWMLRQAACVAHATGFSEASFAARLLSVYGELAHA
jgi:glycosyltransferase involved in cell wall biosynthesis